MQPDLDSHDDSHCISCCDRSELFSFVSRRLCQGLGTMGRATQFICKVSDLGFEFVIQTSSSNASVRLGGVMSGPETEETED